MIISKIKTDDFIYFNLHAEEVIESNFVADNRDGVSCNRLQTTTLLKVIESVKKEDSKYIVFDFKHILKCQPNLNRKITELKSREYKILLLNLNEDLCSELGFNIFENPNNILIENIYSKLYLFEHGNEEFTKLIIDTKNIFEAEFKKKIKKYIHKDYNEPHTSSFVYLTAFVDMKKFISKEKEFLLFSLYRLAMKIRKEWYEELKEKPILVCQSLNSAYLVSVLSSLLGLDILIFDQIGPINKLYNRIDNNIYGKRKYIIVSDLVCLGTEIKIVKSLIEFIGGKCLGNVSLIKTETLSNSDIKRKNATIAVFSIKRSNNKELGYSISTDLEEIS